MNRLLLRWSWRDVRARWVQVAVIALVVALGTAMYAGLMSNTDWAEMSYDASYAALNMHDLRVQTATAAFAERGTLIAALAGLGGQVAAAEERLLVPIQIDASTAERTIIVRGLVVGVDVEDGGPDIDRVFPEAGRALTPSDAGSPVVLVEENFADFYDLPATGEILLAGDRRVTSIGHGIMPEYFMVLPPGGGLFSQADYGVLFTSLDTAETLGGLEGMVNDLVVDLVPGADAAAAATAVEAALAAEHPDFGVTVTTGDEDPTRRLLYDDLQGDRQMMRVFALLIFAGAVAAAFNLTSRMVEATRREIGIGMALGVPRRRIALRPLLVGAQIALLGTVFGIGAGLLVNRAMKGVLQGFLPLPEWRTPFLARHFAGGAAIGFLSTLVAVALPVWRALRVRPVEAIRTGHLAARGAGLSRVLRHLPGGSLGKMPFRNLVRAPRRTVLTALGIGASVTVLVTMVVMVGSFLATIDEGAAEVTRGAPDRMIAGLDTVRPVAAPDVQAVLNAGSVARAVPGLRLPARVSSAAGELDLMLEVTDLAGTLWHPTLLEGDAGTAGLVLSEKAAADLGVGVGDDVVLQHPRLQGFAAVTLEEAVITVGGIHPHPFRFVAYLDDARIGLLGMEGLTNSIDLVPAPGADLGDVQRELIADPAVASVQRADGVATTIRDFLSQFLGIFQIAEVIAVALMLLIAFNSAAVAADERAREHATMLAFGVRRRRILAASMVEAAALGVVATLFGALGGVAFLRWVVRPDMEQTVPDILLRFTVTPGAVALVALLGVAAVAVAPLLTFRKLRRLDIPSTLRVME